MIKNILRISVLGLLMASCSDENMDNPAELASPQTQTIVNDANLTNLGLRLSVDKTQANIFESFIFKLQQNHQSYYFGNLTDYLDVLVFKISDMAGQKIMFQKLENGSEGSIQFSHHFYHPGNYTASIEGYKNGKLIFVDKKNLSVSDTKDFLAVDWNNFAATSNSIGYTNVLSDNYIALYNGFEQMNPYVIMSNSWDHIDPNLTDEIAQKDKEFLYNYLVKYYAAPAYSENTNADLKNIYQQHFKKALKNDIPVNIWMTAKNKIALVKNFSATNPSVFHRYMVIAEPK